jgi:ribonuclease VapC
LNSGLVASSGVPVDLAVDTSALVAILLGEPETEALLRVLGNASHPAIAAANRTELLIVIESRLGPRGAERALTLLAIQGIRTVPVDEALADAAAAAFRRFGKGRHAAGLNFGDCFAYALAARRRVPLLFKGDDFGATDVLLPAAGKDT